MNIPNILHEIEKVDPEVYDRMDTRRSALRNFGNLAGKISLAAIPVALGGLFKKSYAGEKGLNDTVVEILNYALTLEYLEAEFYAMGIAKGTALIPAGAPAAAIQTIGGHETAHVNFLRTAITGAGGAPVAKPKFDFSGAKGAGNGPFKDVFTSYALFLAVAQTFEDTGVRAYKGRAAEIVKGGDVLTAALNIHSVEARHAAHIRQMRKANAFGDVKPWITGKDSGIGPSVQASYNGEELTNQAGIEIVNINGKSISANAASEAFDEPLTKAQVLAIVDPFIAP
ncbi:MAG: ferritin-like domain-containing protein [Gemmatimonadaceae bacterium]|nr:ferritin-like domain-containing protein [Chitinophagaceae bacterium]